MTMRLQDGGDPLWGPFIYDGTKKGEPIEHSIAGPAMFGKDLSECLELVKQARTNAAALMAPTVKEAFEKAHELRADLVAVKRME